MRADPRIGPENQTSFVISDNKEQSRCSPEDLLEAGQAPEDRPLTFYRIHLSSVHVVTGRKESLLPDCPIEQPSGIESPCSERKRMYVVEEGLLN